METVKISKKLLKRLPDYLAYLKSLPENSNVSATSIAKALGLGDVQVRKDLAKVSEAGRRRTGRSREQLIRDIGDYLDFAAKTGTVIVGYINGNEEDVCAEGIWQNYFTERPERLTEGDKKAWLASRRNVALGSDAFFPFSDNIKRAFASGVKYIAEPGGSIRDDLVIEECNRKGMVMAFTGMRLFHH